MAKDKIAAERHRLEKAVQRIVADIAELHHDLRNAPMWPDQITQLKNAILDLEERIANDQSITSQLLNPTNR